VGPGSVVLVPFPFTDLSGRKRRPALIVCATGINPDDVILCGITSHIPQVLSSWETSLGASDLVGREMPKSSVIQIAKLFTCHRSLILGQYGTVTPAKFAEVLARLRDLFSPGPSSGSRSRA
jgi:mRNA interferase MazF